MTMIIAILINMIVIPLYTFYKLKKGRKYPMASYKNVQRMRRIKYIIMGTSLSTILISIFTLCRILYPIHSVDIETGESEELQADYVEKYLTDDIYSQIVFKNELISNEDTIYEFMVNECLHFAYYDKWNKEIFSKKELRDKYFIEIGEDSNLPIASLEDIRDMAKIFYGTSLLPKTDMTLEQINALTPELNERINADPNLYKAELWRRLMACEGDDVSFECVYQAARAADDVIKTLAAQDKLSTKELLFYSSVSIVLYEQAIIKGDGLSRYRTSMIKYRIGEMYFYLYKHLTYNTNSIIDRVKFSEHLLLSAEATLLSGYDDFLTEKENEDIHKSQPYHNSYVAEIECDLIRKYGYTNNDIIAECLIRARNYIASPYSKKSNITSCEDIIKKLETGGYIN